MNHETLKRDFIRTAEAAGAEIFVVADMKSAAESLRDFLKNLKIEKASLASDLEMRLELRNSDVKSSEVGIVRADFGVAETGTLVHFDADDGQKSAWTLPPVCVCFLEEERIVESLEDIADEMSRYLASEKNSHGIQSVAAGEEAASHPSLPVSATVGQVTLRQVSLITGPSRTSDIEAQLTIGVHGPKRLVIFLIEKRAKL